MSRAPAQPSPTASPGGGGTERGQVCVLNCCLIVARLAVRHAASQPSRLRSVIPQSRPSHRFISPAWRYTCPPVPLRKGPNVMGPPMPMPVPMLCPLPRGPSLNLKEGSQFDAIFGPGPAELALSWCVWVALLCFALLACAGPGGFFLPFRLSSSGPAA